MQEKKIFDLDFVDINNNHFEQFINTINNIFVNGGVIFKCFKIKSLSEFITRLNQDNLNGFFQNLLSSEVIRSEIPEFQIKNDLLMDFNFELLQSNNFDNHLIQILINGGAYKKFEENEEAASELVSNFLNVITENRHNDVKIYCSYEPWNKWFYDIAWDFTHIIIDEKKGLLWFFCITDTD